MLFSKNILAVAITTTAFISSAQAAFTNPGDWTRGDANSVYAEWDVFNATTDDAPDIGSANLASGIVTGTNVSKTSTGNLYGSFAIASYNIAITGNASGPVAGDNATVYLQIGKGPGSTGLDLSLIHIYAEQIWPSMIPVDTRFRDASKAGKVISHFDSNSRGAEAYTSLLKTLLTEQERRLRA